MRKLLCCLSALISVWSVNEQSNQWGIWAFNIYTWLNYPWRCYVESMELVFLMIFILNIWQNHPVRYLYLSLLFGWTAYDSLPVFWTRKFYVYPLCETHQITSETGNWSELFCTLNDTYAKPDVSLLILYRMITFTL